MCSAQAAKLGVETDALQSQLDSAPRPTAVDVAECLRIPLPTAGAAGAAAGCAAYRVDGVVYRISKITAIDSKVHAQCHYTERPLTGKHIAATRMSHVHFNLLREHRRRLPPRPAFASLCTE
jgi:hypothetical protein